MAQITYDISELAERYEEAFTLAARGEEVIVVAPGHPPVRLVPAPTRRKPRVFGKRPGAAVIPDDFNDPLPPEYWSGGVP
jgi:antitoxin (DNA-binding transcriptional repressor) of toxin-antitoxin stability system